MITTTPWHCFFFSIFYHWISLWECWTLFQQLSLNQRGSTLTLPVSLCLEILLVYNLVCFSTAHGLLSQEDLKTHTMTKISPLELNFCFPGYIISSKKISLHLSFGNVLLASPWAFIWLLFWQTSLPSQSLLLLAPCQREDNFDRLAVLQFSTLILWTAIMTFQGYILILFCH